MLPRILEPEVMDTPEDARDYDSMDHATVNRRFVDDFLAQHPGAGSQILDVGTGTAQIPIVLLQSAPSLTVTAIDAAAEMIKLAEVNIARAGFTGKIIPTLVNARTLPWPDHSFDAVISNSIVHHIDDPAPVLAEMVRVTRRGGALFVRDLMRPVDRATLDHLVATYAADVIPHQRQLFADSLHAALTVAEVQDLIGKFGFAPETVTATSDRHWTWSAIRR